jgi:hypothetical protein
MEGHFLSNTLPVDLAIRELTRYVTHLGQFQEAIKELGEKVMSAPQPGGILHIRPGDQVLISTWWETAPQHQLPPKYKGPYVVMLATVSAVKGQGIDNCIHLSR